MSKKINIGLYANILAILFFSNCTSSNSETNAKAKPLEIMKSTTIDWQGHRGARGLLPENTIPSFVYALTMNEVKTLELDVVVSADGHIIVSHEPYFSHHISTHPDGRFVTEEEEKTLNIYKYTAKEIEGFDVGKRGNAKFPDQKATPAKKPLFKAMTIAADQFCKKNNRPLPFYNIELKSDPKYYDIYFPQPDKFVATLLNEIKILGIADRCNLQSFDVNILEQIKKQSPTISNALLIEKIGSFEDHLKTISFKPDIYSPYFEFVTADLVTAAHTKGIKVVPWTVNELKDLQRMVDLKVDGIITDYPNRISRIKQ